MRLFFKNTKNGINEQPVTDTHANAVCKNRSISARNFDQKINYLYKGPYAWQAL